MNIFEKVENWGNAHRPGWLDFFRIVLGIFITFKGFEFMFTIESLKGETADMNFAFASAVLAHYVVFAHALFGPLIVAGIFTRFACALQLPILTGAVIFVNYSKGFLSMDLSVSIITLAGLLIFMVFGAGRFSLDERRRNDNVAA